LTRRGPTARGALEGDGAAESLDAVTQSDEPGTARRIGATDTVVADADVQNPVDSRHVDIHSRRLRVLCGVREHLGDDVVGSHLDAIR
jgi:hypothetical protein